MFSSLISSLQTLISTRFLVPGFFPTMGFWFAHAIMLFELNAPFHDFVRTNIENTSMLAVVLTAVLLIAFALSAYVGAALLPWIQSIMEGNWFPWLAAAFAPAQMRAFEQLEREVAKNRRLRANFNRTATGQSQAEAWRASLTAARQVGNGFPTNNFSKYAQSAQNVDRLVGLRGQSRAISGTEISAAVNNLVRDLRTNNADRRGPDDGNTGSTALETTRQRLWDLIEYADQYASTQYRSLVAKRQFSFGPLPLAPTRMGNVARTVLGYSLDRYEFNFEIFWSRLQLYAQKDKDFGAPLQAAKFQLDFLISCSTLIFIWAFLWAGWLYITSGPQLVLLIIALTGPLVGYIFYLVAVEQYRTLADLLRSSVDLFRFDLLAALHHPQPDSVEEERYLWSKIDALHLLYEIEDLRYFHPK